MPEVFIKTELVYLHFPVCHVVSGLVAASFLLANSLISADVLSAALKRYKTTFSKVSLNKVATKTDLQLKTFFCEKNEL